MMPPIRSRVASLSCVTLAIRSARWIAVNRCTSVAEMAIPTLPPSCRSKLNSPVPFGILLIGRAAGGGLGGGQKVNPTPHPHAAKKGGQEEVANPAVGGKMRVLPHPHPEDPPPRHDRQARVEFPRGA